MKTLLVAIVVFLASSLPGLGQYLPVSNSCVAGGQQANVAGTLSSNYLQGVVPACTVTVYHAGTTTPSTLYTSAAGTTPLANPLTADASGRWTFFAYGDACYDVVLSGGSGPTYPSPYTISRLCPRLPPNGAYNPSLVPQPSPLTGWGSIIPTLQSMPSTGKAGLMVVDPNYTGSSTNLMPPFVYNGAATFQNGTMVSDYRDGMFNNTFYNTYSGTSSTNNCSWNSFAADSLRYTSGLSADNCFAFTLNTYTKGETFGNPDSTLHPYQDGWSGGVTLALTHEAYSQGIMSGLGNVLEHSSAGDTIGLDQHILTKGGSTAASDEGIEGFRNASDEMYPVSYTVGANTFTASGQNALTFTASSFGNQTKPGQGIGSSLINASADYNCGITSWSATASSGTPPAATATFAVASGCALPSVGLRPTLGGFGSSEPIALNGIRVTVASIDTGANTFSASIPSTAGAISPISEASAKATRTVQVKLATTDQGNTLGFREFPVTDASGGAITVPQSVVGTLASLLPLGPLSGYVFHATGWSIPSSSSSTATVTIHFSGGAPPAFYPDSPDPHAPLPTVVYLSGFSCAGAPIGLQQTAMVVASSDGSTYITGTIPYDGPAVSCASPLETAGLATIMQRGPLPAGTTLPVNVLLPSPIPCGGSGPSCFSAATAPNLGDPIFIEDIFPEQAYPTAVTPQVDGSVILTVPLHYGHPAGVQVSQHGYAGYRMNMTALAPDNGPYVEYVSSSAMVGSTAYLRAGSISFGNMNGMIYPSLLTLFPGADIDGVVDPNAGNATGSYLLAQAGGDFEPGDSLINPNQMAMTWTGTRVGFGEQSPYINASAEAIQMPGSSTSAVNSVFNVSVVNNQIPVAGQAYPAGLGVLGGNSFLTTPTLMQTRGLFSTGFHFNAPPVGAAGNSGAMILMDGCVNDSAQYSNRYTGSNAFNLWLVNTHAGENVLPCYALQIQSWEIAAPFNGQAIATFTYTYPSHDSADSIIGQTIHLSGFSSSWPGPSQISVTSVSPTVKKFTATINYSGSVIGPTTETNAQGSFQRVTYKSTDLVAEGSLSAGSVTSLGALIGQAPGGLIYAGGGTGPNGITWTLGDTSGGNMSMGRTGASGPGTYVEYGFIRGAYDSTAGVPAMAIGHNFLDNGKTGSDGSSEVVDFYFAHNYGLGIGSGKTLVPAGKIQLGYGNVFIDQSNGRMTAPAFNSASFATDPNVGIPVCAGPNGDLVSVCTGEDHQTFSATPVIDINMTLTTIPLTGNVTSFSFSSATPNYGQQITLMFCQSDTVAHTVTPPANVRGFFTVGSTLGTCSVQSFIYSGATNAWMATGPGVINE